MIVWLPLLIVKDCWTWGAAFQLVLPAWLALIVQVPTVTKVTVVPETVQMLVVAEVKVTVRPEEAVALTVTGALIEGLVGEGAEGDRLVALADREGLLDLGGGVPVGVAGLVGVDGAGADGDEGDGGAGDGADAGGG